MAVEEVENETPPIKAATPSTDEEKLPPTKRYLPKPRKVIIPFVIPWENRAAIRTQQGMGAFGATRNAVTPVSGGQPLKQGEMKSDSILSIFAEGNKYASQMGMSSFGTHRLQTSAFTSSKELEKTRVQASEGIIPRQAGNTDCPTQSGETPIGALRHQVPRIRFQAGMTESMDPGSESEVSKFWTPNPNNRAGTGVIDTRRQAVSHVKGGSPHDAQTEGIIPKLQDRKEIDASIGPTRSGYYGLGPCRQVVTPVTDTFMSELTEIDKRRSQDVLPWTTKPSLSSQAGTGGFQQTRDVVGISNINAVQPAPTAKS